MSERLSNERLQTYASPERIDMTNEELAALSALVNVRIEAMKSANTFRQATGNTIAYTYDEMLADETVEALTRELRQRGVFWITARAGKDREITSKARSMTDAERIKQLEATIADLNYKLAEESGWADRHFSNCGKLIGAALGKCKHVSDQEVEKAAKRIAELEAMVEGRKMTSACADMKG